MLEFQCSEEEKVCSDAVLNVPLPSLSKDLSKKERENRLAKLKQYKLDVRREQWLSQIKEKGCKDDSNGRGESPPSFIQIANEESKILDGLESRSGGEESNGLRTHNTDLESLMKNPIRSNLGIDDSRKGLKRSNSFTSSGSCSGSVSEEEEDGCADNWEAVADALNADDNQHSSNLNSTAQSETSARLANCEQSNKSSKLDLPKSESRRTVSESLMNCQAWMPDDALHPRTLPSLTNQHDILLNSDWHCGNRTITWAWQNIMSQPSSCPICCKDLDVRDSSFLPCSCGFRLCLFCTKGFLRQMVDVQGAGSNMISQTGMWANVANRPNPVGSGHSSSGSEA